MAAKQGFLMYYSKGDAIGTKVSVRYRRSGRLSGVVVKRGSTVYKCTFRVHYKLHHVVIIDYLLFFTIYYFYLYFLIDIHAYT